MARAPTTALSRAAVTLTAMAAVASATTLGGSPIAATAPHNVLVLIADDIGVDRIAAYGEHPAPGATPHIDRLAAEGVLFRRAWANPLCSPTRATLLTGRYSFRTGVGKALLGHPWFPEVGLSTAELTLADALRPAGYTSFALGKWHLGAVADGPEHPLACGFDVHSGSLLNLSGGAGLGAGSYYEWPKSVQGASMVSTTYATTDTADDAVRAVLSMSEPWFCWVAFNAAHKPFHAPPDDLHSFDLAGLPGDTPVPHFKAAVQALDNEVGRLLAALEPRLQARTTVIFVGDNGTPEDAIDAPFDPAHGKGQLYEGGVRVPLIVRGPSVAAPGRDSTALVNTTDLFATVLELAGEPLPTEAQDSISFAPALADPRAAGARDFLFAERFKPNGPPPWDEHVRAAREERFKLIRDEVAQTDELYDLRHDPFETLNLLGQRPLDPAAASAWTRLDVVLSRLEAE